MYLVLTGIEKITEQISFIKGVFFLGKIPSAIIYFNWRIKPVLVKELRPLDLDLSKDLSKATLIAYTSTKKHRQLYKRLAENFTRISLVPRKIAELNFPHENHEKREVAKALKTLKTYLIMRRDLQLLIYTSRLAVAVRKGSKIIYFTFNIDLNNWAIAGKILRYSKPEAALISVYPLKLENHIMLKYKRYTKAQAAAKKYLEYLKYI